MALPSSPPLLPEEYDLPSATTLLPLASGSSVAIRPLHRKRQHSDYGSLSSDPLFSDTTEEDDEGIDLQPPRRKKLTRGPWWNVGRRSKHDLRRSMARKEKMRNADSGVWMGSDASEDSIDSVMSSQQRMQELVVEDEGPADDTEASDEEAPALDAETYAARMVQDCLDRGKEVVNLGDLALTRIPDATLRPLHQLIRPSFSDLTSPPSEDEFGPLTPSITLILSTNQLTTLPTELFNLSNITVLSLRNNHLTELPPAIARLERLQELNIASNNIRDLPWELLSYFERNIRINVRPNPFYQPTDLFAEPSPVQAGASTDDDGRPDDAASAVDDVESLRERSTNHKGLPLREVLETRLRLGRLLVEQQCQTTAEVMKRSLSDDSLIYLASSAIRFFNVDGTQSRQTGAARVQPKDWSATVTPLANAPDLSGSNKAPSLFELALRSIQSTNDISEFLPGHGSHGHDYGLSSSIMAALSRAAVNTATHGNDTCSTCRKRYIVARAEWLEYWSHGSHAKPLAPDSTLPFLRKACSWACAVPTEVGTFR
ncbi:hypothetical protein LTR78_002663 [Recurvomyces mirabilis]|uniref:Uncharacterized protein n=1 Tax=Recurvomyces mirabilis TaxID=574656 RepID=A0AAE0WU16_9PEZI|nr:hypothetical protein LTR78_002663 [Recurvomyces mirabilis]KAK5157592.1 hypothetical protein LTS14_004357 [Recurvomyces mirabilis]